MIPFPHDLIVTMLNIFMLYYSMSVHSTCDLTAHKSPSSNLTAEARHKTHRKKQQQQQRRTTTQGLGPDATDEVEIDFSTLRAPQETTDVLGERADEIAAGLEALREKEGAAGGEGDIASDSSGGIGSGLSMAEGEGVQGGGMGSEEENGEEEEEEEEEEWVGNPSKMPIWKFPVVSRVSVKGTPHAITIFI